MQASSACMAILLCLLACCSGLLQPLLYSLDFAVHTGIACLSFLTCDWSQLHAGISLSMLLHAGVVCLASLTSDWVTACWDGLVVLSMLGIACLAFPVYDWATTGWDTMPTILCSFVSQPLTG